MNKKDF